MNGLILAICSLGLVLALANVAFQVSNVAHAINSINCK